MCVTLLDMKRATVREVQHNLAGVLRWIADGESVEIVRHRKVVARIVPAASPSTAPDWPDFTARARNIWGKAVKGKPVSRLIVDDRDDRL